MIPDQYLQNIPPLRGLPFSYLRELAKLAQSATYYPGQHIVKQGDLGSQLFIITAGQVNLRQTDDTGIERSVAILPMANPADANLRINYFGEQMLSTQTPFEFTAQSVNGCEVYVIERKAFDEFVRLHPEVEATLSFIRTEEKKRTRGFKWVEPGEVVAAIIHKHWWALLPQIIRVLLLIGFALLLSVVAAALGQPILWWIPSVAWIVMLVVLLWVVYDWFNDEYIITTRRVVHVERVLWMQELREGIPIDKIQGVTIEKHGITAWLGVGRLVIQSAGREEGSVVFETVGHPEKVRKLIALQQTHDRARQIAEEREQNRGRIEEELRHYILPQTLPRDSSGPAGPPPRPGFLKWLWRVWQRWVYTSFNREVRQGSMIIWRKHWIVLLQQMKDWLVAFVLLDVALVIYWAVPGVQVLPGGVHLLVGLVLFLIFLAGLWWEWMDWRNDIYAITDTQIIDSEKLPLGLREKTISAPLDQVQDVRVEVPSFWNFVFDFGNVKIETAGKTAQMNFHSVRNPREVADTIFKRLGEYRRQRAETEAALRTHGFVDALVSYHRLVKEEERLTKEQGVTPAPSSAASAGASPDVPPSDERPAAPDEEMGTVPSADADAADS